LDKYVKGDFSLSKSRVSGADFASGTGGVVNNGRWSSTPHENGKRVANFNLIINEFKEAGMTSDGGSGAGDKLDKPKDDDTKDSGDDTKAKGDGLCPPKDWKCSWPPPATAYCCSKWGYLGTSAGHCGDGGKSALTSCCKLENGKLNCSKSVSKPDDSSPKPKKPVPSIKPTDDTKTKPTVDPKPVTPKPAPKNKPRKDGCRDLKLKSIWRKAGIRCGDKHFRNKLWCQYNTFKKNCCMCGGGVRKQKKKKDEVVFKPTKPTKKEEKPKPESTPKPKDVQKKACVSGQLSPAWGTAKCGEGHFANKAYCAYPIFKK